jgi:hypothetical protein
MAGVAPRPKSLAKKKVSPITAGVVIAVVLAMVVFVYMKFGKEKTGWQVDTPEARKLVASVERMGGWRGFAAKMRAMRERRGRGRRGREGRMRGPAPRRDDREKQQQAPASSSIPGR